MPETFAAAEERIIQAAVSAWRSRIEQETSPAASFAHVEANLFHQLELHEQGRTRLEPQDIVDMANAGHGPADLALRRFGRPRLGDDRVNRLHGAVRDYLGRALDRPPLPGYQSRDPQTVNDYIRNSVIPRLVDEVVARWPAVPRLYSTRRRRSAAFFVGVAFGLSERHTARLCSYADLNGQVATFMVGYAKRDDPGPGPSY